MQTSYIVSLLVLCLSVCSVLAASVTCPVQTCAVKGGTCGSEYGNSTTVAFCPSGQFCSTGYICLNSLPVETTCDPAQGNPCTNTSINSCLSTNTPSSTYTCQQTAATKYPGESCSGTDICFFYSPSTSDTNCTSNTCYGVIEGGSCTPGYIECVTGTYCSPSSSQCTAVKGLGQTCAYDSECSSSFCIPVSSDGSSLQCGQANSVPVQGYCDDTQDCAEGLWCDLTASTVGVCAEALNSSNTPCDDDSNCTSPESCVCLYTGISVCQAPSPSQPVGTAAASQDLAECLSDNDCASGAACQYSSCLQETCAWIAVTFSSNPGSNWTNDVLALPCRYTAQQVSLAIACQAKPQDPAPTPSSPPPSSILSSESSSASSTTLVVSTNVVLLFVFAAVVF